MKSIPKLIRRFVGILLLSCIALFGLNLVILGLITASQTPSRHPWITAQEMADSLQIGENGYCLPENELIQLQSTGAWAIFIDNVNHQVVWQTDNLPVQIPRQYTLSDIASLTRGYIDGYPTFTGEKETGLMVLGYPKDSFWKNMQPSWDYQAIAELPKNMILIALLNLLVILLIYLIANTKLLHSVKPIVVGIQALPTGEAIHIRETGVFSELAANINRTSEILQSQNYRLHKKETARANWIAGVSHDIRTPLSTVVIYGSQLAADMTLSETNRQKAAAVVKQGERMGKLINDLNLASKLEYNMQPIHKQPKNAIAVVRQVVVETINSDFDKRYFLEWATDEYLTFCSINVDENLLKRAVMNLIQNSINHNEMGCTIYVAVQKNDDDCVILVEDDGIGASDRQIEQMEKAPHYMLCDTNTEEQRHGLGLLIVKQIVAAHEGRLVITHSVYGGFAAKIFLPLYGEK